jgi:hypothetical protein
MDGPVSLHQYCTLQLGLKSRLCNWKKTGAPPQVIDYIREGHKIPWISRPSKFHHGGFKVPSHLRAAWQELRDKYIKNGAIQLCACTGYTSRAFLIPKKQGGLRLIVDLRRINQHVRKYACRYEGLNTLKSLAKQGYHMVAFDLQDAYQCVSIAEQDRHFLSFCVDGEYFQCSALPFGYTNAPYVFTKVARHFTKLIRSLDTPIPQEGSVQQLEAVDPPFLLAYLDDFLIVAKSPEACQAAVARVLAVCQLLGLRLNLAKCHLEPTQILEHLGMVIDFSSGVFTLSASRKAKVQQEAKALLMAAARNKRVVPLKVLQRFTGLAQSCKLAVPLTDHFLRSLYTDQGSLFKPSWAKLSHQSMSDLKFWVTLAAHNVGAPIWQPPVDVTVFTDASSYAYGAILPDGTELSIPWVGNELDLHINLQELLAVIRVLEASPALSNCVVQLCVDNMCVVHWLAGMSAKSPAAQALLRQLVPLLQERGCVLQPIWIPSEANPADRPSRQCHVETPISVSSRGKWLLQEWLQINMAGWSTLNQPTSQAAAAAFQLQGPPVFVCLPTGSIPKVLQQLWFSHQSALILAPLWEAQVWFPSLAGQADWVAHVPPHVRRQFSNLPSVWGRSRLAVWGVNL